MELHIFFQLALRLPLLPGVVGFLTFNHEAEQYLVTAVLRPGNAPGSKGAVGILRRLIDRLREAFPDAKIRVRLDGGYVSCPARLCAPKHNLTRD